MRPSLPEPDLPSGLELEPQAWPLPSSLRDLPLELEPQAWPLPSSLRDSSSRPVQAESPLEAESPSESAESPLAASPQPSGLALDPSEHSDWAPQRP